jgi:hypothetical protein
MKTFNTIFLGAAMIALCQQTSFEEAVVKGTKVTAGIGKQEPMGTCNPNAYIITLESHSLVNGYWEWVWSVNNPNPGNGNNGTAQNLSHWGMQLAGCVNWSSVTEAAYSSDGLSWTDFTPVNQTDPSQGCMTSPVIKFDFGTSGSAKSYYRLTVSQDYSEGPAVGYYKSGSRTGCCTFNFTGINDCGGPVEVVE